MKEKVKKREGRHTGEIAGASRRYSLAGDRVLVEHMWGLEFDILNHKGKEQSSQRTRRKLEHRVN